MDVQDINRFKALYRFLRPYQGVFGVSIVFHIATTILALLMPWVLKIIIDRALGTGNMVLLYSLLGLVVFLYWMRAGFWFLCHFLTFYPALRMLFDLRMALFKHLQGLSLRFYQEYRTGKLISNILTDVTSLQGMVTTVIICVASSLFALIFVTCSLIFLSPKLSLICLVTLPIVYLLFSGFRKSMKKDSENLRERMSEVSGNLAEVITGVKVVKAFGQERKESAEFTKMLRPTFNISLDLAMKNTSLAILMDQLNIYCAILVLGFGGYMVSQGTMTIGELVAFYTYLGLFFGPIMNMTNMASAISDGTVSAERLMRLLDAVPDIKECANPKRLEHAKGEVKFENVTFGYANERPVLREFTLEIKPGLKVALVGPSGSGKSTIASLLMRFFDTSKGCVLIDDIDVRKLAIESLRKNVGIVLQESFLFSGTIAENIRYGKPDATQEEIFAAARMANAHEFIKSLPKGYESEVGENGVSLSGGQRQRLAIARAILHNPAILILDEATSALDTVSEGVVQDALDKLMHGRTTIIIAHRLSTVRNADMIVVLKDGRIVQKGRHEQLLLEDGVYRELYAMQLKEQKEKHVPNYESGDYDGIAAA